MKLRSKNFNNKETKGIIVFKEKNLDLMDSINTIQNEEVKTLFNNVSIIAKKVTQATKEETKDKGKFEKLAIQYNFVDMLEIENIYERMLVKELLTNKKDFSFKFLECKELLFKRIDNKIEVIISEYAKLPYKEVGFKSNTHVLTLDFVDGQDFIEISELSLKIETMKEKNKSKFDLLKEVFLINPNCLEGSIKQATEKASQELEDTNKDIEILVSNKLKAFDILNAE